MEYTDPLTFIYIFVARQFKANFKNNLLHILEENNKINRVAIAGILTKM